MVPSLHKVDVVYQLQVLLKLAVGLNLSQNYVASDPLTLLQLSDHRFVNEVYD